jgi:hypothetical protein
VAISSEQTASTQGSSDALLFTRRSIDELSELELKRLRRAFEEMMRLADSRSYQKQAAIYARFVRHQDLLFLPWNRAYLMEFERALQQFEPEISLPWWDWSGAMAHREGIPEAFAASTVGDKPNPLYRAEVGDSKGEAPPQTYRKPAPPDRLPGEDAISAMLAIAEFEEFTKALENLHNQLHAWIGGTNRTVHVAAYDPFFWVYQANVDRIWWLWQQVHPEQGPPRAISEQDLVPFDTTVQNVWGPGQLAYDYARATTARSRKFAAGAANDRPASTDELNFSDYAQAFADIISSKNTTPPLTIGIYGQWGIGKSSLLQMIADEFAQPVQDQHRAKVHVVEFNAWKYSANEKIWPALVREIMERMETAAQWTFRARFADTLKRNASRNWRRHRGRAFGALAILVPAAALAVWQLQFNPTLIVAALAVVGIPGLVKLLADTLTNPVSRWVGELVEQGGYGDELPYMREIHADLAFLTQQLHRKSKSDGSRSSEQPVPRVLVMIDDLDRCDPDKAVEVLQAINLLLNFEVFVICLGIDARVITAAVEAHYKRLLGPAGATGYEYLEKIVQIPFRIPLANPLEIAEFLEAQMPERPNGRDGELEQTIDAGTGRGIDPNLRFEANQTAGPGGSSASPPAAGPAAEPVDDTMFSPQEIQGFKELSPFIRRNPRHIKRLVNVYRMVRTLAAQRNAEEILVNPKVTATWIVVCAQWPYSVSVMQESFDAIVERVEAGEKYPQGKPLEDLYRQARPRIVPELQRQTDDDPADLERLFREVPITWKELSRVQPYTLNFNPAIDEALQRGAAEPVDGPAPG